MHSSLIDAGVNLTSNQFDKDRAEVVARAKEAGIENMLLIGCCLKSSEISYDLNSLWAKEIDW